MLTLQSITLETRLPRSLTDAADRALKDYAALFSRATRCYYQATQVGDAPKKPEFSREHGLTARQFNAVKVSVEGMVQSQLSNLPGYLAQAKQKAARLENRLLKNREKAQAQALDAKGKPERAQKLWRSLPGIRSRIQHLHSESVDLANRIKSKNTSICFGSRRLFNAQHHLASNGYADHQAWKIDWCAQRANQFFVLGSSDETGGCQGCVLLPGADGGWILQVRLPEALVAEHGKHVYLDGLNFPYQGHLIEQAHARQQLRSERKKAFAAQAKSGETKIKEAEYLSGMGQALSYRFVQDNKGWRVLVSTSVPFETDVPDYVRGALGIDFNAGFVSVASLNASGHKGTLADLRYDRHQATSRQNKTTMQALAKQIVDQAKAEQKPIVIESLDFARKKSALQKGEQGQSRYNAMLSSLSYRLFRQSLNMQCLKQGVTLVQVNPAYTSLLGKLKYSRETDFNTHQAAAWVIGRRGMGLKERVPRSSPCRVRQRVLTFRAPEDARQGEQHLNKLAKHYAVWAKQAWIQISRVRAYALSTPGTCRTIPF